MLFVGRLEEHGLEDDQLISGEPEHGGVVPIDGESEPINYERGNYEPHLRL